uniref:Aquaporin 8 n=1 Tax=Aotus nancymaae TaxID=37293 RepID=A0A2K5EWH6_AOTNA
MSGERAMCELEFGNGKAREPSVGGRWRASWYERLVQPCLVELLGSALFIFIGCLSVIENGMDTGVLQPALAHGLALGLTIAMLGNIAVSPEERFWNASGAAFVTVQEQGQVAGALGAEIILTTLLALAVCMGAINEKTKGPLAPFSIGFAVTVDILAGGTVSGGCMNPARAFGPAVVAGHWDFHWIYWLGPLLGGLLVGLLIRCFIGDGKTRLILKAQ